MALDPMGVIGSGALLVTASPPEADKILESARLQGISITRIGHIEEADAPSVTMVTSQGYERVPYFERDEVVKIFWEHIEGKVGGRPYSLTKQCKFHHI
ncbi:MAG: hypothetical protein JRJ77_12885 [Deltaproteobacteria bacterium]|nr:hypothetical protein [Deltaproteobacteria bacterium]